MKIDASEMLFDEVTDLIRNNDDFIEIDNCVGQRFIGVGRRGKTITINGTPGNALGAYLDGATIVVNGNVQDAVGDTMNEGKIIVNGSAGDALGYAMRGGEIYVEGSAGYRTGIHMKQYGDKKPVIVVGGNVGSFLGEYLAGGIIIILGLEDKDNKKKMHKEPLVGNFTGTGMHGGKIFVRASEFNYVLPSQVQVCEATDGDMQEIKEYLENYSILFHMDLGEIMNEKFYVITPNSKNPYKKLYVAN